MSLQNIEFVQTTLSPLYWKPRWWDRPRWLLVKLLGGENPHDSIKVTRIAIDTKKFVNQLFLQKRHLFEVFRKEPTRLLIGAEDFQEMMHTPEIMQAIKFNADFHYEHEIYGLQVTVIPWMRGALVMPDDPL